MLHRDNWSRHDGLGALIVTPTRELALQIFEVLRKIGFKHPSLSAGLIIGGGKEFQEEQERIPRMNILVATPGRLLQHLDQTPGFQTDNLKLLVLDEADKILELGFAKTINAILEALPKQRQTLLFSATQTNSIKDLARLSLNSPCMLQVADGETISHDNVGPAKLSAMLPKGLAQYYVVGGLDKKIDWLYSFVRRHLKSKVIVFLASCKQVRFYEEAFCKLQPGVPISSLHGKQKQMKRFALYKDFSRKTAAVLFCTDLAARGLDFPKVDWVLQLDCPDSVETYIHRAGRTARNANDGNSLLYLCPSEKQGMLALLSDNSIIVEEISDKILSAKKAMAKGPSAVNPSSIQPRLASICSQYPEIKYLGQKAAQCYLRSVFLARDKNIFKIKELDADSYCSSMGLPAVPLMKFSSKVDVKNVPRAHVSSSDGSDDDDDSEEKALAQLRDCTSKSKANSKKLRPVLPPPAKIALDSDVMSEEDSSEFLKIKPEGIHASLADQEPSLPSGGKLSKKKLKKLASRGILGHSLSSKHVVFDDDGVERPAYNFETEASILKNLSPTIEPDEPVTNLLIEEASNHLANIKRKLKDQDVDDKALSKSRRLDKRRK